MAPGCYSEIYPFPLSSSASITTAEHRHTTEIVSKYLQYGAEPRLPSKLGPQAQCPVSSSTEKLSPAHEFSLGLSIEWDRKPMECSLFT
jgi:hypothetical protein